MVKEGNIDLARKTILNVSSYCNLQTEEGVPAYILYDRVDRILDTYRLTQESFWLASIDTDVHWIIRPLTNPALTNSAPSWMIRPLCIWMIRPLPLDESAPIFWWSAQKLCLYRNISEVYKALQHRFCHFFAFSFSMREVTFLGAKCFG